jgi:outer membrane lipoprotein-sorting protein
MRILTVSSVACALAVTAFAAASDDILTRMDKNAGRFSAMESELTRVSYTSVIDDKAVESGSILLKKHAARDLQVLINFSKPDAKTVAFRGRKAEIYLPKMKTVQEYDLGRHSNLLDQFLLVGFGTPGKELKANYTVKPLGEETVAGQKTHKLELIPTSAKTKESLSKVELWMAEDGTYPVQQKFVQPSGDYHLITYTDVKLNPEVSDETLKLKLPKGVKREHPQK